MPETITPVALKTLLNADATLRLIDVRTPVEFRELHVRGAKNVPLDRLDPAAFKSDEGDKLYVVCQSGGRSKAACQKLEQAGVVDVIDVDGGTLACEGAGLKVVRGKQAMSLERQVRIAAGALVLFGVALGWFLHPGFFILSAFVGAGLVFAGLTDTCGMGMLLARAPWNQAEIDGDEGATCASNANQAC